MILAKNYETVCKFVKVMPRILWLFLPRDASAERGDATVSCPSVRLSVCL